MKTGIVSRPVVTWSSLIITRNLLTEVINKKKKKINKNSFGYSHFMTCALERLKGKMVTLFGWHKWKGKTDFGTGDWTWDWFIVSISVYKA